MHLPAVGALHRLLIASIRDETRECAARSALVFAPHPDDETLGCGGTILRKRSAGSRVNVAFMTDGKSSHASLLPAERLSAIRQAEAVSACRALGLPPDDVRFLAFPDGQLSAYEDAAIDVVSGLLRGLRPEDVFVPLANDGTSDHEATFRVVLKSIKNERCATWLHEYPIWAWNIWPWVPLELGLRRASLLDAWAAVREGLGAAQLVRLRTGVFVGDLLDEKRAALENHASQMRPLIDVENWPTLSAISRGQFLGCFFRDFELFRVTRIGA
jgi:LmbE family N-acetylglucosaminyl deacetylase